MRLLEELRSGLAMIGVMSIGVWIVCLEMYRRDGRAGAGQAAFYGMSAVAAIAGIAALAWAFLRII